MDVVISALADELEAQLRPLGFTRFDGKRMPAGVQFYAPGTDRGFIEIDGRDVLLRPVEIKVEIDADPVWASGLRALADLLERT